MTYLRDRDLDRAYSAFENELEWFDEFEDELEGFNTSDSFDINKAKRLNFCMKNWLGWEIHQLNIDQLIGFDDTAPQITDLNGDFAKAVRRWQISFNLAVGNFLKPDGIIGYSTLNAMLSALGKPIIKTLPEHPPWLIKSNPQSPYHNSRNGKDITHIIYHATAGGSLQKTIDHFNKNSKKVSAHFVIGKKGEIVQMVPLDRAANHAGRLQSKLGGGFHSANQYSIGIEIVNWGWLVPKGKRYKQVFCRSEVCMPSFCKSKKYGTTLCPYKGKAQKAFPSYYRKTTLLWEPYTEEQYRALLHLTIYLMACIPTITHITGHEHITRAGQRADPGGAFDWPRMKKGLKGLWDIDVGTQFPVEVCDKIARDIKSGQLKFDKTGRIIIPGCP
jgi:N-acetyl-anhydromuramyl-L-alanine amidase AmpD